MLSVTVFQLSGKSAQFNLPTGSNILEVKYNVAAEWRIAPWKLQLVKGTRVGNDNDVFFATLGDTEEISFTAVVQDVPLEKEQMKTLFHGFAKWCDRPDVELAMWALEGSSDRVCLDVSKWLILTAPKKGIKELIAWINDGSRRVWPWTLHALRNLIGGFCHEQAALAVATRIKDVRWEVRFAAVDTLADLAPLRHETCTSFMMTALLDERWEVRRAAVVLLRGVTPKNHIGVTEALIDVLRNDEVRVRKHVATTLKDITSSGNEKLITALIGSLEDDEWEVVRTSASALASFAQKGADEHNGLFAALVTKLGHNHELVRLAVAVALSAHITISDHARIERFVVKLQTGAWQERDGAAMVLKRVAPIGHASAVSALIAAASAQELPLRKSVIEALTHVASRGHEPSILCLIAQLQDPAAEIRLRAAFGLKKLAPKGHLGCTAAAINWLRANNRRRAHAATLLEDLAPKGHVEAVNALIEGMKSNDAEVGKASIAALREVSVVGCPQVIAALREGCQHPQGCVRAFAIESLAAWGVRDVDAPDLIDTGTYN